MMEESARYQDDSSVIDATKRMKTLELGQSKLIANGDFTDIQMVEASIYKTIQYMQMEEFVPQIASIPFKTLQIRYTNPNSQEMTNAMRQIQSKYIHLECVIFTLDINGNFYVVIADNCKGTISVFDPLQPSVTLTNATERLMTSGMTLFDALEIIASEMRIVYPDKQWTYNMDYIKGKTVSSQNDSGVACIIFFQRHFYYKEAYETNYEVMMNNLGKNNEMKDWLIKWFLQ